MNSHLNTCCVGANFSRLAHNSATCDIDPYDDIYELRKNLFIATCATVITASDGINFLLIGHAMIYFGNTLPYSLINPNQIRHFGAYVQDDYTHLNEDAILQHLYKMITHI